jgi:hypothetical protein
MVREENFKSNMRMIVFLVLFILMTSIIALGIIMVMEVSPFSDVLRLIFGFLIGGLYGIASIIYIVDTIQRHRSIREISS